MSRNVDAMVAPPPPRVDACAHQLFAEQVRMRPESPAVCAHDGNFSYAQLDELSSRVAQHLVRQGMTLEHNVVLCFEKSAWAIVAMLGVVKAGGVCVNVSPSYPRGRLLDIIADCRAKIVLTNVVPSKLPLSEADGGGLTIETINSRTVNELQPAETALDIQITPANAVYVLFTSGSTGKPKGIVIEHGSLCTSASAHGSAWGIGPGTRVFQFSSYTFDVSVADIFFSLMRGACICTPSENDRLEDPAAAAELMQANWAFLTPSVAATIRAESMPGLETLLLGGEAPSTDNIREWFSATKLILCTGPAECSIYCSGTQPCDLTTSPSSIGKGIGGRLWVANPADPSQLVAPGEAGELLIEGRIVARGYLNNPHQTSLRFLVEPEWLPVEPDVKELRRVYRTGDLVRQNADGSFSFVARIDDQIKIHGQRVELREIEAQISACLPAELPVKVLFDSNPSWQKQCLVAFIVTKNSKDGVQDSAKATGASPMHLVRGLNSSLLEYLRDVRRRIEQHLPSYMVPAYFYPLRAMPLTLNGKADVAVLRSIIGGMSADENMPFSLQDQSMDAGFESSTEKAIGTLYSKVLHVPVSSVHAHSNFFALGGNSLTAMHLVRLAREEDIQVPYRAVMTARNLREMAEECTITTASGTAKGASLDEAGTRDEPEPARLLRLKPDIATLCGVAGDDIEQISECLPSQKALYTASLLYPGSHVLRNVYQLGPHVDTNRFKEAWDTVIARFPILRTRIVSTRGEDMWLQVVTRSGVAWEEYEDPATCLANFALDSSPGSPLIRLALLSSSPKGLPDDSELCKAFAFTCNHALYDSFTYHKVMEAVSRTYHATPWPYHIAATQTVGEFLQRTKASLSEPHENESYWLRIFGDEQVPTRWPEDVSSSTPSSYETLEASLCLGDRRGWSSMAQQFTDAVIMQAAFGLLLSSYSGTRQSVYGLTLSGRQSGLAEDAWQVVGPTLATVPFRAVWSDSDTLQDVLVRTLAATLDASQHMHADFQALSASEPRFASASSYGAILVVQPEATDTCYGIGLDTPSDTYEVLSSHPLALECIPERGRVCVNLEFDANVLNRHTAQRFVQQFEAIITEILHSGPLRRVVDVPVVCRADLDKLEQWNSGCSIQPLDLCIHDVIMARAASDPCAQAICSTSLSLTYDELARMSMRTAQALMSHGLTSEKIVPICSDKSPLVAVAALGVLRAGCAFVLLDDTIPLQRLHTIVRQVEARLVLTSEAMKDKFDGICDRTLGLESLVLSEGLVCDNSILPEPASSRSLAYVVFTSGSTGVPKGVMIEHSSFVTAGLARAPRIRRDTASRVYQFSSYAFDTCIEDMFLTLMVGGCVCIPSERERKDELARSFAALRANTADMTPSSSTLLSPERFTGLEVLILGGEALTAAVVRTWSSKVCLINTYGPAECSVVTTVAEPASLSSFDPMNMGRAWCGRVWVVDPLNASRILPIGAQGELVVEGPALARGYLGTSSDMNAFVTTSLLGQKDVRLYRTGDIVSYNEDGTISFRARKDTQIKIRGQRVELAEIEARLTTIEGVSAAAADFLAPQDSSEKSLVAFVCLSGDAGEAESLQHASTSNPVGLLTTDTRDRLVHIGSICSSTLPVYMVPEAFIPITYLPTTISGKLDRTRLRDIARSMDREKLMPYRLNIEMTESVTSTPLTDTERLLQRMWSQTLDIGLRNIHKKSHFFRLGGHSLTAIKLVAECRAQGSMVTVADVFQNPILEDMAMALSSSRRQDEGLSLTNMAEEKSHPSDLLGEHRKIQRLPSLEDVLESLAFDVSADEIETLCPCSPMQEGLMLISARQKLAYTAQHVYELGPDVDVARLKNAWSQVIRLAPIMRTAIIFAEGCGHVQVVLRNPQILGNSTEALDQYLEKDRDIGFGYGTPLTRLQFIQQPNGQHYFVYSAHHSVFDGESLDLLLAHAAEIYRGRPPPPTLFHCDAFIKYVSERTDASKTHFWKAYFGGFQGNPFPKAAKPVSGAASRIQRTAAHKFQLPSTEHHQVTLATVLRASWALVLGHYSESSDVVFGLTLSGRNAPVPGVERLAWPTMTTIPVRTILNREMKVNELLQTTQRQMTEMIAHEQDGLQIIERVAPGSTKFENILVVHYRSATTSDPHNDTPILKPSPAHNGSSQDYHSHALVLDCILEDESVCLEACFDENAISSSVMQSVLYCFAHIASQVASAGPAYLIDQLEFCSPEDQAKILQWNNSTPSFVNMCVQDMVASQVLIQPQAVAVDAWDGTLTYAQLDHQADILARHLVARGVFAMPTGRVVPVCFRKSKFTIISMLAVLKAGGAYVPMDPSYPELRLQAMADQVHATVVLTDQTHCDSFGEKSLVVDDALIVACDAADRSTPDDGWREVRKPHPDDAALIVFTSGSTGKPKGVVLSHRSFCTLVMRTGPKLGLDSTSRVLQMAAHAFDVSNNEIFMVLAHGGCVCIAEEERRFNDIQGVINNFRINWLFLTPTATAALEEPAAVPGLRTLILGGEAVRQDIIDTWAPTVRLISTYGPAEGTIWPSITPFPWPLTISPLNIGRGDECHMWLADQQCPGKLAAVGAVGEIILEGPLVADGYFEDERTKGVFISDPEWFQRVSGMERNRRWYRTGDTAQYNDDGSLTFCGRITSTIKLRGMRVDLGDVEYQVKKNASPNSYISVELLKNAFGQDAIIAFIASGQAQTQAAVAAAEVPAQDQQADRKEDLRRREPTSPSIIDRPDVALSSELQTIAAGVRRALPHYMIPEAIIPLTSMPKTASGKTDRRNLRIMWELSLKSRPRPCETATPSSGTGTPTLQASSSSSDTGCTSLGDSGHDQVAETLTQTLRQLWAHILQMDVKNIDLSGHFFELGGDSLAAMRLASLSRRRGLEISVTDIWQAPLLRDMAARAVSVDTLPDATASKPETREISLAALPQEKLKQLCTALDIPVLKDIHCCTPVQEILIHLSSEQPGAYVADFCFEIGGGVDLQRFKASWQQTYDAFDNLRTHIMEEDDLGLVQVISGPSKIVWQDALEQTSTTSGWHGRQLSSFYILPPSTTQGRPRFLLRMHHAIFDGHTSDLIMRYARAAYEGEQCDTLKPRPYGDFVDKVMQDSVISASKDFWTSQLSGSKALSFPPLRSGEAASPSGNLHRRSIVHHSFVLLRPASKQVTLSVHIQAAWALLLSFITAAPDVMFSYTASGRDTGVADIELIAGPTIATFPRRVVVDPKASVGEYLTEIATATASSIPYQHIGMHRITQATRINAPRNRLLIDDSSERRVDGGSEEWLQALDTDEAEYLTDPLMVHCSIERAHDDSRVRLGLSMNFAEDVFPLSIATPLLRHFEHIIQYVSSGPTNLIGDLDICQTLAEKLELSTGLFVPSGHAAAEIISSVVQASDTKTPGRGQGPDKPTDTDDQALLIIKSLAVKVLRIPEAELDVRSSWIQMGGDSISAMRLASASRAARLPVAASQVLASQSMLELARLASVQSCSEKTPSQATTPGQNGLDRFWKELEVLDRRAQEGIPSQVKNNQGLQFVGYATGMQELMFDPIRSGGRAWNNILTVDIGADFELGAVHRAITDLVANTDILRSIFFNMNGRLRLAIMNTVPVSVEELVGCDSLEDATSRWVEQELARPSTLCEGTIRSGIFRDKNGHTRVAINLHHCRYDGVCLPLLYDDLMSACHGRSLPYRHSFIQYAIATEELNKSADASIKWRELLEGSRMTTIAKRGGGPRPATGCLAKTITAHTARNSGVTFATVLKTAWAAVLSSWAHTDDVVFGQLVSGRSIEVTHADEIIGPCLNLIPVRARLGKHGQAAEDLQAQLQQQSLASSLWEAVGIERISQVCGWGARDGSGGAAGVRFGSIVQLQNIDDTDSLMRDTSSSKVGLVCPDLDVTDIWIIVIPMGNHKFQVEVNYCPSTLPHDSAQMLLDILTETMVRMCASPRTPISELVPSTIKLPTLPL